jgi:hypothetical protein
MQASGRGAAKPPMGIAFEGDLGTRVDAVLAVAMLYGFSGKTESRNIALCISRPGVKAAQLADVLVGFYAGRAVGGFATIGMPESGPPSDETFPAALLAKKNAEGAPLYTSNIGRMLDTADNAVLIRNQLLAQNDQNATIVLAGPATGLVRLLGLYGSRPQVTTKVKQLVVAVGAFPTGPADPSVKGDLAAARTLFAEWPTPIVAVGTEVGDALPYPGVSIDRDFGWSPAHPVADAYRVFKPMPYNAPATALAAALYAVHPDDGYFKLSDPGTISVTDDGRTQFTPGANGKHRYVIVDPEQKDRITKLYSDMVSATPPPRTGRGRGGEPTP